MNITIDCIFKTSETHKKIIQNRIKDSITENVKFQNLTNDEMDITFNENKDYPEVIINPYNHDILAMIQYIVLVEKFDRWYSL